MGAKGQDLVSGCLAPAGTAAAAPDALPARLPVQERSIKVKAAPFGPGWAADHLLLICPAGRPSQHPRSAGAAHPPAACSGAPLRCAGGDAVSGVLAGAGRQRGAYAQGRARCSGKGGAVQPACAREPGLRVLMRRPRPCAAAGGHAAHPAGPGGGGAAAGGGLPGVGAHRWAGRRAARRAGHASRVQPGQGRAAQAVRAASGTRPRGSRYFPRSLSRPAPQAPTPSAQRKRRARANRACSGARAVCGGEHGGEAARQGQQQGPALLARSQEDLRDGAAGGRAARAARPCLLGALGAVGRSGGASLLGRKRTPTAPPLLASAS